MAHLWGGTLLEKPPKPSTKVWKGFQQFSLRANHRASFTNLIKWIERKSLIQNGTSGGCPKQMTSPFILNPKFDKRKREWVSTVEISYKGVRQVYGVDAVKLVVSEILEPLFIEAMRRGMIAVSHSAGEKLNRYNDVIEYDAPDGIIPVDKGDE